MKSSRRAGPASPLEPVRDRFRTLAATLLPEAAELDPDGWERLETIVARALAERPAAVGRQLRLFVRLAWMLPVARHGRTFGGLSAAGRVSFLRRLERAPLLLLRRGVWGLRTLVFMGYYGQEEVRSGIGYRAHPRGWEARPGARPSAAGGAP